MFCGPSGVVRYLQVGLLAALDELMESGRSEVGVDVGGVEPLQGIHDDLLEDERTEDAFGGTDAELVDVVDSWEERERSEGLPSFSLHPNNKLPDFSHLGAI